MSINKKIRPLLVLEINEVPWRMIDHFRNQPEFPHISKFFSGAKTFTTVAEERGELSPWITWPSLHRGMNGDSHLVRFLGQDPKTFAGVPIWEEYLAAGRSIGLCGSLQSWPAREPGAGGFYIPDTFARDSRCIPSRVNAFQALNLRLTSENGRVIRRNLPLGKEAIRALLAAPLLGIRAQTMLAVARQLIRELFRRQDSARRPVFQAKLQWDIFRKLYLTSNPPAYAAFFTNHLANIMHRYWSHVFPEDFSEKDKPKETSHYATMKFAVAELERILADALKMQEKNPDLILAFATSMGQNAIVWNGFEEVSTIVTNSSLLLNTLCERGGEKDFSRSVAMVPQITVEISEEKLRAQAISALNSATTASGKKLFFLEERGAQLSISIRTPDGPDILAGGFSFLGAGGKTRRSGWKEAGIEVTEVGPASAYHVPEGILAIRGRGIAAEDRRNKVPLAQVKELLLETVGLGMQTTSQCSSAEKFSIGLPLTASTTS